MKLRRSPIAWFVLVLVSMPIVAIVGIALVGGFRTKELPVLGKLPEFSLTERSGRPVNREEFRGKVWVAGFLYTGCSTECPLITAKMQRLQNKFRFKERWRLVAITSDPEHDTPSVLKTFAEKSNADPYKWLFLTGDKGQVRSLTEKGFHLAVDPKDPSVHSVKLVLVDHLANIRGYYDALDDKSVDTLIKDTKSLLRKAF